MSDENQNDSVWAAVDVGTNSIHLVVAKTAADGGFEVLTTEKAMVRLGEGAQDQLSLAPGAIKRGVATLQRFKLLADSYGAEMRVVATSAVREAPNGPEFIKRVKDEADVDVSVISGAEEARLIHLGVLHALPVYDDAILVVDIGGGSTEFVAGRGDTVDAARSLRVGHIRITDRFFPGGVIEPGSVEACREWIRSYLEPARQAVGRFGHDVAIGSSGTISALAGIEAAQSQEPSDRPVVTGAGLTSAIEALLAYPDPESRLAVPGLEEKRADVIVGGALLLEQIFDRFAIEEMVVSPFALREGVLVDAAYRQHGTDGLHHLSNIRRDSVYRLLEASEESPELLGHCTDLALSLFDDLVPLHGLNEQARDVLEAGALLHNVGLFISHSAHHKHSYYVISNSDRLLGFTQNEIELIALVARYHRKAEPRLGHLPYQRLSESDQRLVSTCAGILRIAIALDRTRAGVVESATAQVSPERRIIDITCQVTPDADPGLEIYTAQQRSTLLATTYGVSVQLQVE